jgi:hypothetical protein
MKIGSIFGLLVLIADVYAIIKILQSRAQPGPKIVWILVVLIFPLVGVIAWFFVGPGARRR